MDYFDSSIWIQAALEKGAAFWLKTGKLTNTNLHLNEYESRQNGHTHLYLKAT